MKANNPKHKENLRPFKKGEDDPRRNKAGAPKKIPTLDSLLSQIPESDYKAVIEKLVSKAKQGNVHAADSLLDRAYGKPKQSMDLSGEITIPVTGMVIEK